ncbi:hypothetical protein GALMADRAFT_208951 [Galerina marginata CBS 339.88]|uniref:Uncharacterized protein n=1 Tax=Galerina marginata (strain CBS 339.88) TaxID=685588 RepID=A0A067TBC5_GALM3|nr:hypothetical protein GALMADRAFT_208951 [Galerina marginata CBS 339.88]
MPVNLDYERRTYGESGGFLEKDIRKHHQHGRQRRNGDGNIEKKVIGLKTKSTEKRGASRKRKRTPRTNPLTEHHLPDEQVGRRRLTRSTQMGGFMTMTRQDKDGGIPGGGERHSFLLFVFKGVGV